MPSLTLYSLTLPLKLPVAINSPLGENLTVQTSSEWCRGGGREEDRRQKRAVEERDGEYAVYKNMQVHLLLSSLAAKGCLSFGIKPNNKHTLDTTQVRT